MTDVLSDLLDLVRIERVDVMVFEIAAPGGVSVPVDGNMWFHLVLEGGLVYDPAAEGGAIQLQRGDMVLLLGGETFAIRDTPGSPVTSLGELWEMRRRSDLPWIKFGGAGPKALMISGVFRIDRDRAKPLLRHLPRVVHLKSEPGVVPYWVGPLGDLTELRLVSMGPGSVPMMRRLVEATFVQMIRVFMAKSNLHTDPILSTLCRPQVSAALRLMNTRPEAEWTVSNLAREIGMSRSAFAAAFAAEVGQSPMHYLTDVRMSIASELLRSQTLSVSQIAFRVGFISETSFARTFKRHFGVAPGAYRRPEKPPVDDKKKPIERGAYPGFVFFG